MTTAPGDQRMRALLAAQDMAAERRRAAALGRRHHLEVVEAHMAGVSLAPCRTMVAEDIRDLQRRARHPRRALGGRLMLALVLLGPQQSEAIQRAHDLASGLVHVCCLRSIAHRRCALCLLLRRERAFPESADSLPRAYRRRRDPHSAAPIRRSERLRDRDRRFFSRDLRDLRTLPHGPRLRRAQALPQPA
jgi:hypothetical protein